MMINYLILSVKMIFQTSNVHLWKFLRVCENFKGILLQFPFQLFYPNLFIFRLPRFIGPLIFLSKAETFFVLFFEQKFEKKI